MAVVTFGGAYSVLAYVAQQAVTTYNWLSPRELLNGLWMAETTPGPLIMVLQFVGLLGAYRNPGAPFIERMCGNVALTGALSEIMAAVVGVVLNLAS